MSLSNEVIRGLARGTFYLEKDVKQFINDLKQELSGIPTIMVGDPDFTDDQEWLIDTEEINKRINKLAGDKLI